MGGGGCSPLQHLTFTAEEIRSAAKQCKFKKGIGNDGFDGEVIGKDEALDSKIFADIAAALNERKIPEFLKHGRLIPLSKIRTQATVKVDDIRPIVVKSHLTKIIEKAIFARVKDSHEHLFKTGPY